MDVVVFTVHFYAALLPRRGPHIASHSVCLSVRPVIVAIGNVFSTTASVTSRHLANYNDTHVLFGTHWGPHIVRPSRPHKLVGFGFSVLLVWRGGGKIGKNPDPARTNRTRTQVLPKTETEPESKNMQEPEPNRTIPHREPNRTWTQMSWFLLGSFTEWNCRYIHTL